MVFRRKLTAFLFLKLLIIPLLTIEETCSCSELSNGNHDGYDEHARNEELFDRLNDEVENVSIEEFPSDYESENEEVDAEDTKITDFILDYDDTLSDVVGDEEFNEPPMEPIFTFAIITDTHVTGSGENADRLTSAINWINEHIDERMIELVLVLGDIGWDDGLEIGRTLLDGLLIPYVPVIGDNEIHAGDEEMFNTTYAPHFEFLSTIFENWQKEIVPVWNPETGRNSWFQNFSFRYHDLYFIGLDWNVRRGGVVEGELGDIHNFPGGTFWWLETLLPSLTDPLNDGIILFSHIPMHFGSFWFDEMDEISRLLLPYSDYVFANFAGHVHITYERDVPSAGYVVEVTDATFDDDNVIRLVYVRGNGIRFEYLQEIVVAG